MKKDKISEEIEDQTWVCGNTKFSFVPLNSCDIELSRRKEKKKLREAMYFLYI